MDSRQRVVVNVRYQSPKGKGASKLKGLLRYIQYRNDRNGHIPQRQGLERWVDHGLGSSFGEIAGRCEEWKSPHVQAFTWVVNPNPDLIDLVPDRQRMAFVRELTERTMQSFFEARGIDDIEYSYCLHRRETNDAEPPGRDNPHAHVILPGMVMSWADGGRVPLYMNQNRRENHIELLHQVAEAQMGDLMLEYAGPEWEKTYDLRMAERQRAVTVERTEEMVEPDVEESALALEEYLDELDELEVGDEWPMDLEL